MPDSRLAQDVAATAGEESLAGVARTLAAAAGDPLTTRAGKPSLPAGAEAARFLDLVRSLAFPGFFEQAPAAGQALDAWTKERLAGAHALLAGLAERAFAWAGDRGAPLAKDAPAGPPRKQAAAIADGFAQQLPTLRHALSLDVQAAYDGDPAAQHTDETIVCYPGLEAIFVHRVAHALLRAGAPLLPRLLAERCHRDTAIDIHPGAVIGESFFIDHGTGVVIGETAEVGDHVKIYHGVTLGNKSFPKDEYGQCMRGMKRHPTIGDRVTIYANAVVLGGDTVLGDDCIISAGAIVAESVPPGQLVQQPRSELVLRANREIQRGS